MIDRNTLSIPHDFEAEQAVLGSIFLDNETINDILSILTPNSFHTETHRHIYRAVLELVESESPVDEITTGDQLSKFGKLDEIGGYGYLAELSESVPSSGSVPYYAKIVQQHALARDLISATNDIGRKGRDPQQNISDLLAEAESKISEIQQRSINKDFQHIKEGFPDAFGTLEKASENKDEIIGLETGLNELDRITAGLQPSDLVILAARPSMGKTALALNVTTHIATKSKNKGAVLVFSLEMSKQQLILRMLSSEGKVDSRKLKTGNLDVDDWDKIAMATETLSIAPIYINDDPGIDISEITAITKKLDKQFEHGVSAVIVDYLQLMGGNKKLPREQQIAEISRGLKGIAKNMDIPVIALSQLNRSLENRTDKRPKLSDLRESGSIEQDADIILFIYRDEVYNEDTEKKGIAELIIAKHRNGPTGMVELVFRGVYTKFENMRNY